MKNKIFGTAICFVILIATACKKENDQAINMTGNWRGNVHTFGTLLVAKENGKCRIYLSTLYEDTTQAGYTWDGEYAKTGKGYEFKFYNDTTVTCVLKAEQVSPQKITGTAFVLQAALDFELKKY